ncbi:MAG: hypothetical protein R3E32_21190 [Chitinophagales bacterium]
MKNLLFKNRFFLFAAIILLTVLPLSFQFSIQEEKTPLTFVFLQDFPKMALFLAGIAIFLAFTTYSIFTNREQFGIMALFFLVPLTCVSIGEMPLTFIAWDFQPAIGWMYWGTGLLLFALKSNSSAFSK